MFERFQNGTSPDSSQATIFRRSARFDRKMKIAPQLRARARLSRQRWLLVPPGEAAWRWLYNGADWLVSETHGGRGRRPCSLFPICAAIPGLEMPSQV